MIRAIHPAAVPAVLATFLLAVPLAAQEVPAAPGFTLQPVEGGVLKLDTGSGALSFCSAKGGAWVCEAVPEDRRALEEEIARLQARIAELEQGGRRSGGVPDIMAPPLSSRPSPPGEEGSAGQGTGESMAEAERKLDRAMDMAEHVFRRFFDMVNRLRGEEEAAPKPQKL